MIVGCLHKADGAQLSGHAYHFLTCGTIFAHLAEVELRFFLVIATSTESFCASTLQRWFDDDLTGFSLPVTILQPCGPIGHSTVATQYDGISGDLMIRDLQCY